ncbi:MAG: DUF3578 domain-containing protein [Tumebacillaceae bacterium]
MVLPAPLSSIFQKRNKSYKMALILSLLDTVDNDGKASFGDVSRRFHEIYKSRESNKLVTDPPPTRVTNWRNLSGAQIRSVLDSPVTALDTILRRQFQSSNQGLEEYIRFKDTIWLEMTSDHIEELRTYAEREFQKDMSKLWVSKYFSIQHHFVHILDQYLQAKQQSRGGHELAEFVTKKIPRDFHKLPFIKPYDTIKASVGQPAWAKTPWIAIMDTRITETTQEHYYVCYIFSESMDECYLAIKHAIPQSPHESIREKIEDIRKKINFKRFDTNDLVDWSQAKSTNYLSGIIAYKKYDRHNLPDDEQLFSDLCEMLNHYNQYANYDLGIDNIDEEDANEVEDTKIADENVAQVVSQIKTFIQSRGFSYPDNLIENFYLSLKSKPFVILAGISGTGKTKLVKLFAEALGATRENGQFHLIPVRPDWNDPSDLIGYTALSGEFRPGKLTEVLMEASKIENRAKPYFVCLDEMNLARVEHYFSDLLSLLETQEWQDGQIVTDRVIPLASLCEEDRETYRELCIPQNVYFIGTVNMDETTHPFSKKVLDRANTIEFNHIDLNNLDSLQEIPRDIEFVQVDQSFVRGDYLILQDATGHQDLIQSTVEKLVTLNQVLEEIHSHVGFRVRDAVCFYMIYNQRFDLIPEAAAFDIQLTQKIFPRIQGSNMSVKRALIRLYHFAENGRATAASENEVYDASALYKPLEKRDGFNDFLYPVSARKIAFMLRRFEEDGFTSFWLS